MSGPVTSCKLHVFLAANAPVGVILRRGPSKRVQLIKWDLDTDTFLPGQWFHGRIYEDRCDLSPDGKLFIYFALKMNINSPYYPEYKGSWTAISKPPYLTALALWPNGSTWGGGGFFLSEKKLWINHYGKYDSKPHPKHKPIGLHISTKQWSIDDPSPVLTSRLSRNGWVNLRESSDQCHHRELARVAENGQHDQIEIFHKQSLCGKITLVMRRTNRQSQYYYDYLLSSVSGRFFVLPGAQWADWDHRGRLLFTREGCIFSCQPDDQGDYRNHLLADFTNARPESISTPIWAMDW